MGTGKVPWSQDCAIRLRSILVFFIYGGVCEGEGFAANEYIYIFLCGLTIGGQGSDKVANIFFCSAMGLYERPDD